MPKKYNAPEVEKKWQKKWSASKLYNVDIKKTAPKDKYYNLSMFPYPSGDKLHIGHWYNFAPADSHGRFMRMNGKTVFEPMGFDSFGLPAENYAIKTGVHPQKSIAQNAGKMVEQLSKMGTMYDWDKTLKTSDPEYYKWTQWVFLQLYKAGLAYKKKQAVNWCPSCQTVLANEQVIEGACDRCKHEVEKKDLKQWFFKISDYAEKLLDYKGLDWPENTKAMQSNWIGKSKGVNFKCKIKGFDHKFDIYDSVPQTHMAQTFAVIAAGHPLLPKLIKGKKEEKAVLACMKRIEKKKMANKFDIDKDMDGAFTGCYIEDPYGTGDLPLWVASFVVMDYGSGIVNCSAHDERDFDFAKKYSIPLRPVMFPKDPKEAKKVENLEYCYHHAEDGVLAAPEKFKGRGWGEAREDIIDYLEKNGIGERVTNYKLRDWLISRQRYWGAPIPIVYCPKCGEVPVPEKDLPVELPLDVKFELRGDGLSPLAHSRKFMNAVCPKCKGAAKRESDTMDTFVCSSWYYLRYPSVGAAGSSKKAFDPEVTKKWLPVDMYVGGPEHACMHLLYARFFTKVLHDLGHINFDEPFKKLIHQGMITKDGAKMSKSKGNVVSPDSFVERYGSDVFRMYLMFMGPFTQGGAWNDKGIKGIARFVEKFWGLIESADNKSVSDKENLRTVLHKTIKKVTKDTEDFHFNTVLSSLMEFVNVAVITGIDKASAKKAVQLIAPMAPHMAEECWEMLGEKGSVMDGGWPKHNEKYLAVSNVTYAIQVNGKMRGTIDCPVDAGKDEVLKAAAAESNVAKHLSEGTVVKEIFVPGKIVGFVVKV